MTANQKGKRCLPAAFGGSRRGQSGMWVSDLLPHTAAIADDLTFIRSMHGEQINHAPAVTHLLCGHNLPGRPSIGAIGAMPRNLGPRLIGSSFASIM